MLLYWDSIDSKIHPNPSLMSLSMLYTIFWKSILRPNLWFIMVFGVELKQTGLNSISPFGLYFVSVTFSVIWYLKPFASFKRPLNKSVILDLLASNCLIGSFLNDFITYCISFKHTICFYYIQFFVKRKFRKQINDF